MAVLKETEKILEVISAPFYGLPTSKVEYLKDLYWMLTLWINLIILTLSTRSVKK